MSKTNFKEALGLIIPSLGKDVAKSVIGHEHLSFLGGLREGLGLALASNILCLFSSCNINF